MQRGAVLPLILIIILFISAPFIFWALTSTEDTPSIKGVSSKNMDKGLMTGVSSSYGTWDMHQYLCKSKDECEETLMSGNRDVLVSGGETVRQDIPIVPEADWKDYTYLKVYVQPSWGSQDRLFNISGHENIPGSNVFEMKEGGSSYDVLVIPIQELTSGFAGSVLFSDTQN